MSLIESGVIRLREWTPRGAGGVSVLRLQGAGVLPLIESWGVSLPSVGELRMARLTLGGEEVDEALVCVLAEDEVELHLHGSPPLIDEFLSRLPAGSPQNPAVSIEERAAQALCDAPCELAARVLLDQAEGALRRELQSWCELDLSQVAHRRAQLLADSRGASRLFEPTRVLLAGPVNAGKSTLFNLLVGGERVITSAEAGTTRDLIEEPAVLGGWPILLRDGAGFRELAVGEERHAVERAGQATSLRAGREADLIIWLRPPGAAQAPAPPEGVCQVELSSLGDLAADGAGGISSAVDPMGAVHRVEALLREEFELPKDPWSPGRPILFEPGLQLEVEGWQDLIGAALKARIQVCLDGEQPGR